MLDNKDNRHTLGICSPLRFFAATIVAQTLLNVTLYVRTLLVFLLSFQMGLSLKVSEYNFAYIPQLHHAFYLTRPYCLPVIPKGCEASQYVVS
jgi:hypothetical protein